MILARSNEIFQVSDESIERFAYLLNVIYKLVPFVGDVSRWCEIGRELSFHLVDVIIVDSVFPFKRSEKSMSTGPINVSSIMTTCTVPGFVGFSVASIYN